MSLVGEIGNGYKYFSKRIKRYNLEYLNIHTRINCDCRNRMRGGD
jgi:hypothetical protein